MDNRNFQIQNETGDKKKKKTFFRNVGIFFLALGLAVLTVVVISISL